MPSPSLRSLALVALLALPSAAPRRSSAASIFVGGDPSGGEILIVDSPPTTIFRLDVKSRVRTDVYTVPDGFTIGSGCWSYDGSRVALAVTTTDGTKSKIEVVPVGTGPFTGIPRVVHELESRGLAIWLSWGAPIPTTAPDGEILFTENLAGADVVPGVLAIRADADRDMVDVPPVKTTAREYALPPGTISFFGPVAYSPNGDRIAVTALTPLGQFESRPDVWRVEADGASPTQIGPLDCAIPEWSPDGKRLSCKVGSTVYDIDAETGAATNVAALNQKINVSEPVFWSSFDTRFTYNGLADGPSTTLIQVYDTVSGAWLPPAPALTGLSNGVVFGWRPTPYVAMGDSYGAGVGNPPYFPDGRGCLRSRRAYPYQLGLQIPVTFTACTGAQIRDFVDGVPASATAAAIPPQTSYLSDATALVTVFLGGNDVEFAPIFESCLLNATVPGHVACEQATVLTTVDTVAQRFAFSIARLRAELPKVYEAIRRRAKNARILVMGYPSSMSQTPTEACLGLDATDQRYLHSAVERVNEAIEFAVLEAGGAAAEFLDPNVASDFPAHTVCAPNPWFLGPVFPPGDFHTSLHPNEAGQTELARLIAAKLTTFPPSGLPVRVLPLTTTTAQLLNGSANFRLAAATPASATFAARWPAGDVEVSLVSPTGRIIDRTTTADDVVHGIGSTFERFTVRAAETGEWTMNLYGADVPAGGEDAEVLLWITPPPDPTPLPTSTVTPTPSTLPTPLTAEAKASRACRKEIGKRATALVKAALAVIDACHAARDTGKIVADCNDLDAADVKHRIAKATAALRSAVDKKCRPGDAVRANYPGGDIAGALPSAVLPLLESDSADVLGAPDVAGDKVRRMCHLTIAKARSNDVREIVKRGVECQGALDKTGASFGPILPACVGTPFKAAPKGETAIGKKCAAVGVGATDVGSCEPLPTCVGDAAATTGNLVLQAVYAPPAP